jgi:hypothetical protein
MEFPFYLINQLISDWQKTEILIWFEQLILLIYLKNTTEQRTAVFFCNEFVWFSTTRYQLVFFLTRGNFGTQPRSLRPVAGTIVELLYSLRDRQAIRTVDLQNSVQRPPTFDLWESARLRQRPINYFLSPWIYIFPPEVNGRWFRGRFNPHRFL